MVQLQLSGQVSAEEIDRRSAEWKGFLIAGVKIVVSVITLTVGVVVTSLSNLKEFYGFHGGMSIAIGLLFLLGGILLVLGLATRKPILLSLYIGVVANLIGLKCYYMSVVISGLVENGNSDIPNRMVAIFYGICFAVQISAILSLGGCMGTILGYRSTILKSSCDAKAKSTIATESTEFCV